MAFDVSQVIDSNGSSTMVAAESEEEMTTWMQALCMAACEEVRGRNDDLCNVPCTICILSF